MYSNAAQQLLVEKDKLKRINAIEQQITDKTIQLDCFTEELVSKHMQFNHKYEDFCKKVQLEKENVLVTPHIKFNSDAYRNFTDAFFDGRSSKNQNIFSYEYVEKEEYCKRVKGVFKNILIREYALKGSTSIEKVAEEWITTNFFRIDYDIRYQGDNLKSMSEGKTAFVILRLLLDFSSNDYPILIDQPEDDLDNRAIYHELVKYIRTKKQTRQIILVTHNPNIVVGADAEEIIVANQDGVNNKNQSGIKFKYRTDALEESYINHNPDDVLTQKGIREHVCEILEGGDVAFRIREEKYHL